MGIRRGAPPIGRLIGEGVRTSGHKSGFNVFIYLMNLSHIAMSACRDVHLRPIGTRFAYRYFYNVGLIYGLAQSGGTDLF